MQINHSLYIYASAPYKYESVCLEPYTMEGLFLWTKKLYDSTVPYRTIPYVLYWYSQFIFRKEKPVRYGVVQLYRTAIIENFRLYNSKVSSTTVMKENESITLEYLSQINPSPSF